jgi:FAD/FMN-containing dehydrogenase
VQNSLHATADAIGQLRAEVRGRVIAPGDPDYDTARTVYYTGIDRRPAAIVRVSGTDDVARAVRLARDAELALAVRSGGHSVAGHGVVDDGIVLDLAAMRRLDLDLAARTAWAETGLTAGAYTSAAGAHGLATGFGDAASVGIGGITLGGGIGFLHRKFGLTIDNLLAAEVVTAAGEVVYADREVHPDLFWAIRGGGGNFGVATRFRYRLHEVGDVVSGMLIFPATPALITDLLAAVAEAPEELSGVINVAPAPPLPMIPAEYHGRPILLALLVHSGPAAAGAREFAKLRALGSPIVDLVRTVAYPAIYEGAEPPHPALIAARSFCLDVVDRGNAESILDALQKSRASFRVAQFRVLGGAVARMPRDETAFAHRERGLVAVVAAAYDSPAEEVEHRAWAARLAEELRQGEPGGYIGFMGAADEAQVRAVYPGATWDRLRAVKGRYDPENLFRLNANIPPA